MTSNQLPEVGLLRLHQILGSSTSTPPIPPIIPVGKTAWWQGINDGIYPPPMKLSKRTTVWKVSDIRQLIEHGRWVAQSDDVDL